MVDVQLGLGRPLADDLARDEGGDRDDRGGLVEQLRAPLQVARVAPGAHGRVGQGRVEAVVVHDERHAEPFGEVERAQAVGAEVRVDEGDAARPARPLQPAEQVAGHVLEDRVPVAAAPDADDDVGLG